MLNLGPLKIPKKLPININNPKHSKYSIKVYYLCINNANIIANNTYKLIKFNTLALQSCEKDFAKFGFGLPALPFWECETLAC